MRTLSEYNLNWQLFVYLYYKPNMYCLRLYFEVYTQ